MTTQKLDSHYHPILWSPSATAFLICAILIILSATIYVPPRVETLLNVASPSGQILAARSALPFTIKEVQSHFAREIGTVPVQFADTSVFPQPATLDDSDEYEIAVAVNENAGITVEFRGTGRSAINLAKGFFGSSIFRPNETANLISMVGRMHESPTVRLPRFKVDMRLIELIDMDRLTILFSPLD